MKNYQVVDRTAENPVVSVAMLAYNHSKYIKEAIDSVLMQEVNFTIQLVIAEDCSSDNTRDIILDYQKKYPHIIKLILQNQNVGAKQNNFDLFENLEGKYVAALEGDDYWIVKDKLQKQLTFLEGTENVGLVYTNVMLLENGNLTNRKFQYTNKRELGVSNCIPTLTSFFVNDKPLFKKFFSILIDKEWPLGDYPLWLMLSKKYEIKGINEIMGVYRITPGTASRPSAYTKEFEFIKAVFDIQLFFNDNEEEEVIGDRFLKEFVKFLIRRGDSINYIDFLTYRKYLQEINKCSFYLKWLTIICSNVLIAKNLSKLFNLYKRV